MNRGLDATRSQPPVGHSDFLAASSVRHTTHVVLRGAICRLDAAGRGAMTEEELIAAGWSEPEVSDYEGLHAEGVGCEE